MQTRLLTFVALALASAAAIAQQPRFPVLQKVPRASRDAFTALLDWERTLRGLAEAEVYARFGKPEMTKELSANAATKKPMHMDIYRLSRRSQLQITIHEDRVAAVGMVVLASASEDDPIDD